MIGNSDDETNFPHKLLLTNRQFENLRKPFPTYVSKTQLSKMIQAGGFLGKLLGPLSRTGLPLIQTLVKSVIIPLGLTAAAASAADAGIHKKILASAHNKTFIISNDEVKDILKIVKSLEDSGILLKGITETIKDEASEQHGGFLSMLLSTVDATSLGKLLAGKGVIRAGEGKIRDGYGSKS